VSPLEPKIPRGNCLASACQTKDKPCKFEFESVMQNATRHKFICQFIGYQAFILDYLPIHLKYNNTAAAEQGLSDIFEPDGVSELLILISALRYEQYRISG
jgi:hypothetical protein